MKGEEIHIYDPFGRSICISKKLFSQYKEELNAYDLYDDFLSVIKNPAIMIETIDLPKEFLYFRSLGWYLSVLIRVKFKNKFWEAYNCTLNPSDAVIVELLKKGKQLL